MSQPVMRPVLFLLVLVAALTGSVIRKSALASPSLGPSAFADESNAELATDGERLWIAVSGYRRDGSFVLKVFEKENREWLELASPPGEVSGDLPVSIVASDAVAEDGVVPCLGYSAGGARRPIVTCLEGDDWHSRGLPDVRGGELIQLSIGDGGLLALVARGQRKGYQLRVLREADGHWSSTPQLPAPASVAQLAIGKVSSDSPAIGLATQERSAKRLVFQLRGGKWQQLDPAVEDIGVGPLTGGPILLGNRVLYPVTQADSMPWSFSVQSARIGAPDTKVSRLSGGAGNAQGSLDLADGQVWATWQENHPLKDGRFRTWIYAAELSRTGRVKRKIRLWHGLSIGPGSMQVLSFQGETLALFMRGSSNGHGLQATVKALPPTD